MSARTAQEALGLHFDRGTRAGAFVLLLALAALWLLGRRYGGLSHDATLYLLTGLHRLAPAAFDGDLFFAHGSQDAYTIFSFLYAPLIAALGPGDAALALTMAGQAGFFFAVAALVPRLVRGPARWWSLALLAAASGYYGGFGVFRVAETFATARTLAEPLVVAALVFALVARPLMAWALLLAAAVIHPLVAGPGIAVSLLAAAARRLEWRQALVAAGLALAAFVAVLLVAGDRFDGLWRAAVEDRSPHLFLALWMPPDWARVLWGICAIALALRALDGGARRIVLAVVVVGIGGIVASGVAVDGIGSATAAGLQLWRSHWLMQLFALLLAPAAVASLWRGGPAGHAAAACLAASCCFGRAELPAAAVLALLAACIDAASRRRPGWIGERGARWVIVAAACAASAGLLFEVQARLPSVYGAVRPVLWTDYVHAGGSVGGLLPLALLLWLLAHSRLRQAGVAFAALALAFAAAAWDARAPWPRFVEMAGRGAHPFSGAVPAGAQVFWPAAHSPSWIVLGRPTWFTDDQGAGIVFSRETAIAYAGRKRASLDLMTAEENCRNDPACRIDARRARVLCERADGPDYLVLGARVGEIASIDWPLPPGVLGGVQALHLYSCAAVAGKEKGRREAGPS